MSGILKLHLSLALSNRPGFLWISEWWWNACLLLEGFLTLSDLYAGLSERSLQRERLLTNA